MTNIRCGVVDYLNALPLWEALKADPEIELIPEIPSKLAQMLNDKEIDLGLLPVIEYFRIPDVVIVPGFGISADGHVDSVRLFYKDKPESIKRVILDASSRTSAALTQIILSDHYGLAPNYETAQISPAELDTMGADAALLIGDAALKAIDQTKLKSLDLASEWKNLSGLPFVFATWLVRESVVSQPLIDRLKKAATDGLAQREKLANAAQSTLGMPLSRAREYLFTTIRYELGDSEIAGLEEFARRAARLGLCDHRPVAVAR